MALPRTPQEGNDNTENQGDNDNVSTPEEVETPEGVESEGNAEVDETLETDVTPEEDEAPEVEEDSETDEVLDSEETGTPEVEETLNSGDVEEPEADTEIENGAEEDLDSPQDDLDATREINDGLSGEEFESINRNVMNESRRNDPLFATPVPRSTDDDTVVIPRDDIADEGSPEEYWDANDSEENDLDSTLVDGDSEDATTGDDEAFESSPHHLGAAEEGTENNPELAESNSSAAMPAVVPLSTDGDLDDEVSLDTAGNPVVTRRDRRSQKEDELSRKNNTKKNWIMGLVILVVLLLAGGAYLLTSGVLDGESEDEEIVAAEEEVQTVSVPSALGFISAEDEDEVGCERYTSIGLECLVTYESSEDVPRGNNISQSIEIGEFVEVGETIEVVYSAGPETSEFPAINNESLEYVEEQLWAMGVLVEDLEYVSGSGIPEERVVEASVEEGETVNNGDSVVIYLSDGTVEIPDWTDETRDVVETEASDLGVDVVFVSEESEETEGTVLSQSESGEVSFNDIIEVTVAAPFESVEIEIPDILGLSPTEAQSDLAEAGFRNISTLEVATGEVDEETVTQVSPGVGNTGMSEERVVIVVSVPTDADTTADAEAGGSDD